MNTTKNSNFFNDKVYQLLTKVAKTEPTVELELYWLKRYQEIIDNTSFNLSDHTVDMVFESLVSKPSTPSGLINIEQIIDGKNQIQETSLQNIIETSVRLLDAILDIIQFDESAKKTVREFRKIAIGIENLESYLTIPEMLTDQIDYLGELISNSVYRSSESLAEEKGACLRWEDIKSDISSKSFEYWFNPDSGEIRTSLEIQEYITNNPELESKVIGEFEIVARRGSHLLLYPNTQEWHKWSDRKQSTPQVATSESDKLEAVDLVEILEEVEIDGEIPELVDQTVEFNLPDKIEEDPVENADLPKFLQNEPKTESSDDQIEINEEIDSLNQHIAKVNQENPNKLQERNTSTPKMSKEHNKNFAFPEMVAMEDVLPGLIGDTHNWNNSEDDFSSIFGLGKFNNKPSSSPTNAKANIQQIEEGRVQPLKIEIAKEEDIEEVVEPIEKLEVEEMPEVESNPQLEPEIKTEEISESESVQPTFGIGELVKVANESDMSDFYQIVDIIDGTNGQIYHLTDRDDAHIVKSCTFDQIQPALLEELILSANIGTRVKNEESSIIPTTQGQTLEYWAQAIVFNQNGQVLLDGDNLPRVIVPQDTSNIETLNKYLNAEHNIAIKDIEEIGTFASDESVKTVFLGQLDDEVNQTKSLGLSVVDIDKALALVPHLEKYLSKATEKEMQAKKRFSQLNNQLKNLLEENQNIKQKIRLLGLNLQVLADENLDNELSKSNNIQKAISNRGDYNYLHTTEHSRFSKFFPVIEQVIEDEEIGKIVLKVQYDSFGAKKASIIVDSDKLRDKDNVLLTSYLNLVNTSLASGASLADVSYVLEHQGKGKLDFGNNLINKILLILSLCFLSMPRSIEQINSSDVIIVTLAKVLESINYNQTLLEIVLDEKVGSEDKPITKNNRFTKKPR